MFALKTRTPGKLLISLLHWLVPVEVNFFPHYFSITISLSLRQYWARDLPTLYSNQRNETCLHCVGFKVLIVVTIFWDVMPCSPVEVHWNFGGTYYLHLQGRSVNQVSRALLAACFLGRIRFFQMEAIRSSETSLDFFRTRPRYNPEDRNLQAKTNSSTLKLFS
jgi:hypothetical protein